MVPSRHNIFLKLRGSNRWFLANLLSRQADLLDNETARQYQDGNFADQVDWIDKGYLVDPIHEAQLYKRGYLDFLDQRERDEVQIFFAATYDCNFACSYCYQEGYDGHHRLATPEVVEAFFSYIDATFSGRRKYLTLFGGEPLLDGAPVQAFVKKFLDEAAARNLETSIVTNGYHLIDYLPLLTRYSIREVQVTLDGLAEVHNSRRPHRGGKPSFDRIAQGIDQALAGGLSINLRMVVDRENLAELPKLAEFAKTRGWSSHPAFKTQLGRNYELHTCQSETQRLYSRVELYEDVAKLVHEFPQILDFHRPAFSISKFLWEQGELPQALYDSCPGTKTEWAFDVSGRIFSCTATVGKSGEELGTFYPEVRLDQNRLAEWQDRDVTTIPECHDCALALACGGGCASVAKNQSGNILAPDCRPVRELLSLGVDLYFPETEEILV